MWKTPDFRIVQKDGSIKSPSRQRDDEESREEKISSIIKEYGEQIAKEADNIDCFVCGWLNKDGGESTRFASRPSASWRDELGLIELMKHDLFVDFDEHDDPQPPESA